MNDFSIIIQIWRKIDFGVTALWGIISLKKIRHDSTDVMPFAIFHKDHFATIWARGEWIFHQIWVTMEKLSMKLGPGEHFFDLPQTG